MNVTLSLFKFLVLLLSLGQISWAQDLAGEFFSQTVYLHKFQNPITQNKLILLKRIDKIQGYGGLWFDFDSKTNAEEGFTDAQLAPLIGARSDVFGPNWLNSRLFVEGRFVHRTKSFPDDRIKNTYEARAGMIGYGFKEFSSPFFFENYYSAFYSRLYGEKFILQGWARQGLRFSQHFDLFNEIFADTFDQTRNRDGTLDLRPGGRFIWDFSGGSFQLLHQWLYHFSNLDYAGRNESRSTVVLGLYW